MLIGISPAISPVLLEVLDRMGHGDELVLTDAFYPGDTMGKRCIRADGISVPQLLKGILPLITIDTMVSDGIVMMNPEKNDTADPAVEKSFLDVIKKYRPEAPQITKISRTEFYERAKKSYAVVVSGSFVKYGCIIIRKGVLPVPTDF
jgi:L-fucose mutarotase